jgi:putative transposase
MAARAVGLSRATLYRWERRPATKSRRPRRPRGRQWTRELARAIEELRNDNPMWGKRKIAILLRREGIDVLISTAGRILDHLVARRAIVPVPILRRRSGRGASASPQSNATPAAGQAGVTASAPRRWRQAAS